MPILVGGFLPAASLLLFWQHKGKSLSSRETAICLLNPSTKIAHIFIWLSQDSIDPLWRQLHHVSDVNIIYVMAVQWPLTSADEYISHDSHWPCVLVICRWIIEQQGWDWGDNASAWVIIPTCNFEIHSIPGNPGWNVELWVHVST